MIESGRNTTPMVLKMGNREIETKTIDDFQPPYCFKEGSRLTFNRVGSCEFNCPDGKKHSRLRLNKFILKFINLYRLR